VPRDVEFIWLLYWFGFRTIGMPWGKETAASVQVAWAFPSDCLGRTRLCTISQGRGCTSLLCSNGF